MNPMNIIAKATSPKVSASTPNIFGRETFDKLSLTNHPHFLKFIKKHGDKNEKLVYSNYTIKINHKGKEQKRILVISDKAIYNVGEATNIKKSPLGKLKRRIELHQIHAITLSCISDEFVLHAPNEYDYHYKSDEKFNISKIIEYILHSEKKECQIVYVQQESLHELANADEKTAKKQTVNEKFEKYWQARNALKRNGIEQEIKDDGMGDNDGNTFDYKKLIEALKQDAEDKSYHNKYNLDIKSDTEIFSDPTMDTELLASGDNITYDKDEEDDDDLLIPCNDYIEIGPLWMKFEKLMLDSSDGHQIVLAKHIINKRYYILNITNKELVYNEQTWFNKYQQLSFFKNIDSFKTRNYRFKNNLDFSLFRYDSRLELFNKSVDVENIGNAQNDIDDEKEDQFIDQINIRDFDINQMNWNDEFSVKDYVVGRFDIIQTPKSIIEITEYYNSGDLSIHLQKNKKFSLKQCKYIIAQVVLAMHYLHKNMRYIIYDLKPENIYIDSNGYIAIYEVQQLDELKENIKTELNIRNGAPEYLSPEILSKDHKVLDVESDYWSLGILTYELLVGLPPFFSDNMEEYDSYLDKGDNICIRMMQNKIMKLTTQKLEFPKEMDISAQNFISKLLVVDPTKRLTKFEDITKDPFFENIPWRKLLYRAHKLPFKPPKLNRFGKIESALGQDWSGRKILDGWFINTSLNETQLKVFEKLKNYNDISMWKYFAKLENQI